MWRSRSPIPRSFVPIRPLGAYLVSPPSTAAVCFLLCTPSLKGAIDTTIVVIRCGTAVERDFLFQHVVSKQRDGAFFVIEARLGQRGPVRPVV